jgi:hypothetical protein
MRNSCISSNCLLSIYCIYDSHRSRERARQTCKNAFLSIVKLCMQLCQKRFSRLPMDLFINVLFACFGYKANRNLCFRVSFERDRKKYHYCRHTVIRFPTLHWRLSSFVSAMSKERLGLKKN